MTTLVPSKKAAVASIPAAIPGSSSTTSSYSSSYIPQSSSPANFEQQAVHATYTAIAPHFNATRRFRPWPRVVRFLAAQPAGAVGIDAGCGNAKYAASNPSVWLLGFDPCRELLLCAQENVDAAAAAAATTTDGSVLPKSSPEQAECEVGRKANLKLGEVGTAARHKLPVGDSSVQASILTPPIATGRADFVICIAVLHHLSTRERRVSAVRALLELLRPPKLRPEANEEVQPHKSRKELVEAEGNLAESTPCNTAGVGAQALLYVWALEQENSRRGWKGGGEQDLLVPWVLKGKTLQSNSTAGGEQPRNKVRNKPSTQDVPPSENADSMIAADHTIGHADNVHEDSSSGDVNAGGHPSAADPPNTYRRYYHLYARGELEADVVAAGGSVLESGWERDNWWVVCQRAPNSCLSTSLVGN